MTGPVVAVDGSDTCEAAGEGCMNRAGGGSLCGLLGFVDVCGRDISYSSATQRLVSGLCPYAVLSVRQKGKCGLPCHLMALRWKISRAATCRT